MSLINRLTTILLPGIAGRKRRREAVRRFGIAAIEPSADFHITADSEFGEGCRLGPRTLIDRSSLGRFSYVDADSRIHRATIGNFCSIANRVSVGPPNHPTVGQASSHPAFYLHRPSWGYTFSSGDTHDEYQQTTIGHDVWIGVGVTIVGGVHIGDGCIVGAGAVVTKDLEPFSIAVGVPAKVTRRRFTVREIAALEEVAWWHRDSQWLHANVNLLQDIDALVDFVEGGRT